MRDLDRDIAKRASEITAGYNEKLRGIRAGPGDRLTKRDAARRLYGQARAEMVALRRELRSQREAEINEREARLYGPIKGDEDRFRDAIAQLASAGGKPSDALAVARLSADYVLERAAASLAKAQGDSRTVREFIDGHPDRQEAAREIAALRAIGTDRREQLREAELFSLRSADDIRFEDSPVEVAG